METRKKIVTAINNISLKNKLVILFLLVSLIPVLIIGIVSYNISSNIMKTNEIEDKMQILDAMGQKTEKIINEKQLSGIRFHLDGQIQEMLGRESQFNRDADKNFAIHVKELLFDSQNTIGVNSIILYSNDGPVYKYTKHQNSVLNDDQKRDWYQKYLKGGKVYNWGDIQHVNGESVIPFIRGISNTENLKPLGLLVINLRESYLQNVYESFAGQGPGFYFIVNSRNNVVSSSKRQDILGENVFNQFGFNTKELTASGYLEKDIDSKRYLLIYKTNGLTGWKFFSIVPIEEILLVSSNIKRITMLLSVLCIFICLMISMFLSQRVTEPIQKLMLMMQRAEKGNLNVRFVPGYNDEIGKLAESFNRMISRLKRLIKKTIAIEKEKREAELKVLGFQINPHFLYNTLSSIIWLSNAGKNEEVIRLTKALSNFFRISISKGKEIIKIRDEITHIKNYLEIQKIRYCEEFEYIFEIEPEIEDYYLPKLVLQPLVENAIYHGIKNLDQEKGLIILEGDREDRLIYFRVKDNGGTLDEQRIDYINQFLDNQTQTDEDFGIGIRNVNDRLQLYFGKEYGLRFRKDGRFTVAEIVLPVSREGDINV